MEVMKGRWLPVILLLLGGFSFSAGAQDDLRKLLQQAPLRVPSVQQVDRVRERLEEAQTDQERYRLLTQLIQTLERLRATSEVTEAYEQLFLLAPLADPAARFRWVIQLGNYLERQARPGEAARIYERFLGEFTTAEGESPGPYRTELKLRMLSALVRSGEYRRAKPVALEILDATDSGSQLAVFSPLMDLADSDMLTMAELDRLESLLLEQRRAFDLLPRLMRLYVNQGRPQKASSLLDRLLERDPKFFLAQVDVAQEIYFGLLEEAAADYLLKKLDALAEAGRDEPEFKLIRARWLDRTGRTEEALAFLEQQPKNVEMFQKELASLYFGSGQYAPAADAYKELIRIDPKNVSYLRWYGECFHRQGRREEAIGIWETIPVAANKTAVSYQSLADIYRSHEMFREAVGAIKKALKLPRADEFELQGRILDLWVEAEDYEALLREHLRVSLLQGVFESAFRARIVEQVTEPERALRLQEVLERRLEADVDPVRRRYLRQLGTDLWVAQGEYDRAIAFIEEANTSVTELGLGLYLLGSELSRRGAADKAIDAWSRIPQESRYAPQARQQTAELSLRTGRLEEARQAAEGLVAGLFEQRKLPPPKVAGGIESASLQQQVRMFKGADRLRLGSALLVLAQVALEQKRPGAALEALLALEQIVQRKRPGLLPLLFGHAYSQLGSLETAREYYAKAIQESLPHSRERCEAEFFLTECYLWQDESLEALDRYLELARGAPGEAFANEALRRYLVAGFAGAEQLYHYSLATLFEWKGDWEEAVRLYREAAADDAESDVAGWCLYEVSRILIEDGQYDSAARQIDHILGRYEHPTLLAECRVLQTRLPGAEPEAAGVTAEATGPYLGLILDYPDTLYSDLSRLKLEGRLQEPF